MNDKFYSEMKFIMETMNQTWSNLIGMTYLGIYASFGRFAIAEDSSLKRIKKVKINKTVFGCIMGFDITSKTRYNIRKSRQKDRWPKNVKQIPGTSNYPKKNFMNQPEILQVEFKTLLITLFISFLLCAGLTYSLILVSK